MKWTMIASAGVAILLFILWVISPSSYDSTPLTNRLLASGPNPAPFVEAMPDHDWDIVCYNDEPYASASKRLRLILGRNFKDFAFEPFDESIGESETALLFINMNLRIIHIYILKKSVIYTITGPYCLKNSQAFFSVEVSEYFSEPYKHLKFVAGN